MFRTFLNYAQTWKLIVSLVLFTGLFPFQEVRAQCDPTVPLFTVDLSQSPFAFWQSPSVYRAGLCCGNSSPDVCIKFVVTLHPKSEGVVLDIVSGAIPGGSLFYQVGCGPIIPVGQKICLNPPGPYTITFCKPGNNENVYQIRSVSKPSASDDINVVQGCAGKIYASGLDMSTITWNSVFPGPPGTYNSYLSCVTGCDTAYVDPQAGFPPYVDYQVCGMPESVCQPPQMFCDTVRVYFFPGLTATFQPTSKIICFGDSGLWLTANVSGGIAPHKILWNTGDTVNSIFAGAGTYTLSITDATGCNNIESTTVILNSAPVAANAGPDISVCANRVPINVSGSVTAATGGIWSGGNGTYTPGNTALSIAYTPTAQEIAAGQVNLILTPTGAIGGCPAQADTVNITINPLPVTPNITYSGANPPSMPSSDTVCVGTNAKQYWVPNTPGSTYQWTVTGNGNIITGTGSSINVSWSGVPGVDTLKVREVSQYGCVGPLKVLPVIRLPLPQANAGNNGAICGGNTYNITTASALNFTTLLWTSSGTGIFLNNGSLTPTYVPSAADIASGIITLTLTANGMGPCASASSSMSLTINPMPQVSAGPNAMICAGQSFVVSGATASNYTSLNWTTSGTGSFINNGTLNPVYYPGPADSANGTVVLTVTANGIAPCGSISSNMTLSITKPPQAYAGPNDAVCSGQSYTVSSATATYYNSVNWTSSGSGTFINNGTLNPTYTPSTADIANGNVTLTLTATGSTPCTNITSSFLLSIIPMPQVDAGVGGTICAGQGYTVTSATAGFYSGLTWTTLGTGTFVNNGTLTPTYNPSPADIAAGNVKLYLIANGFAPCGTAMDSILLIIIGLPVADAGPDDVICEGNSYAVSGASASNYSSVLWTTTGTGILASNNTLTPVYTPSSADISLGYVNLIMTVNGILPCGLTRDTVRLDISRFPMVSAGKGGTICGGNAFSIIDASASNYSSFYWTSTGTGTFSSNKLLTPVYTPSAADIANGSVSLILTVYGIPPCGNIVDTCKLIIIPAPVVYPGADANICTGTSYMIAGATAGNYSSLLWTSSGTGAFVNGNTLIPVYVPSAGDIANGSVTLTLTANGLAPCTNISDSKTLFIRGKSLTNPIINIEYPSITGAVIDTLCLSKTSGRYAVSGDPGSTFKWFIDNGNVISHSKFYDTVQVVWANDTGFFKMNVIQYSIYGCPSDTVSAWVYIKEGVGLAIQGPDEVCEGTVIELHAVGDHYYKWGTGASTEIIKDRPLQTTKYMLVGTNVCGKDTAYHRVRVFPSPRANFTYAPQSPCKYDDVHFVYTGTNIEKIQWYFWNDQLMSEAKSFNHTFNDFGDELVKIVVSDQWGCTDSIEQLINICEGHVLWIPNAFSPNNDGQNDVFRVKGYNVYQFKMLVYNRWGNVVFESEDIAQGWDGTFRGRQCPMGVYTYFIIYNGDGKELLSNKSKRRGEIVLIR